MPAVAHDDRLARQSVGLEGCEHERHLAWLAENGMKPGDGNLSPEFLKKKRARTTVFLLRALTAATFVVYLLNVKKKKERKTR